MALIVIALASVAVAAGRMWIGWSATVVPR